MVGGGGEDGVPAWGEDGVGEGEEVAGVGGGEVDAPVGAAPAEVVVPERGVEAL